MVFILRRVCAARRFLGVCSMHEESVPGDEEIDDFDDQSYTEVDDEALQMFVERVGTILADDEAGRRRVLGGFSTIVSPRCAEKIASLTGVSMETLKQWQQEYRIAVESGKAEKRPARRKTRKKGGERPAAGKKEKPDAAGKAAGHAADSPPKAPVSGGTEHMDFGAAAAAAVPGDSSSTASFLREEQILESKRWVLSYKLEAGMELLHRLRATNEALIEGREVKAEDALILTEESADRVEESLEVLRKAADAAVAVPGILTEESVDQLLDGLDKLFEAVETVKAPPGGSSAGQTGGPAGS